MPKAEKGTPKDIANRMKAKGLQKLKFYCQMCAKQCRDENGFKCHMTSDSHLRQMRIFRENAGGMMDSFSREFEVAYMETLRRRHGTQRMNANNVYQEVIQDKHHVHMNSTKWATLTDFVQYLGKKGLCVVEETERGWYVTYIERDPALLDRREKAERKAEADRREEQAAAERRKAQRIEAARLLDRAGCSVDRKASGIGDRDASEGARVEVKLGGPPAGRLAGKKRKAGEKLTLVEEDSDSDGSGEGGVGGTASGKGAVVPRGDGPRGQQPPPKESQRRNPAKKEKQRAPQNGKNARGDVPERQKHRNDSGPGGRGDRSWLRRDIVVRIISKTLSGGEYYRRKAVVDRVVDGYEAEVEVLESRRGARDGGDVLRLDQDDLETVVPRETGERVRIVGGRHTGKRARVVRLDKERYRAELRLSGEDGIVELDYEDFSKKA